MKRGVAQVVPESLAAESNAEIDHCALAALLSFFLLLDKWDRETRQNAKIV